MSIIKQYDPRSGKTYVYESQSYWDKEKKQPRAKRRLIGRLDEATGEVVPTDGRGRKRKSPAVPAGSTDVEKLQAELREKEARIRQLEEENRGLKQKNQDVADSLKELLGRL